MDSSAQEFLDRIEREGLATDEKGVTLDIDTALDTNEMLLTFNTLLMTRIKPDTPEPEVLAIRFLRSRIIEITDMITDELNKQGVL